MKKQNRRLKTYCLTFLASGFGSGWSPVVPGTVGSMVGVILYILFLRHCPLYLYLTMVILAFGVGVWVCQVALQQETRRDPPWIVWDEIVGMWVTLLGIPPQVQWIVAGFILFRFFDILKPGPVRWCERYFSGGWGIMMDDLCAAILSCMILHGLNYI